MEQIINSASPEKVKQFLHEAAVIGIRGLTCEDNFNLNDYEKWLQLHADLYEIKEEDN